MTILQFAPLLAVTGAVCVVGWAPHGHLPLVEVATPDRAPFSGTDGAPNKSASMTGGPKSLRTTSVLSCLLLRRP